MRGGKWSAVQGLSRWSRSSEQNARVFIDPLCAGGFLGSAGQRGRGLAIPSAQVISGQVNHLSGSDCPLQADPAPVNGGQTKSQQTSLHSPIGRAARTSLSERGPLAALATGVLRSNKSMRHQRPHAAAFHPLLGRLLIPSENNSRGVRHKKKKPSGSCTKCKEQRGTACSVFFAAPEFYFFSSGRGSRS
jgi:hypothetical protein